MEVSPFRGPFPGMTALLATPGAEQFSPSLDRPADTQLGAVLPDLIQNWRNLGHLFLRQKPRIVFFYYLDATMNCKTSLSKRASFLKHMSSKYVSRVMRPVRH
jgi:hypothetical protein